MGMGVITNYHRANINQFVKEGMYKMVFEVFCSKIVGWYFRYCLRNSGRKYESACILIYFQSAQNNPGYYDRLFFCYIDQQD